MKSVLLSQESACTTAEWLCLLQFMGTKNDGTNTKHNVLACVLLQVVPSLSYLIAKTTRHEFPPTGNYDVVFMTMRTTQKSAQRTYVIKDILN
jgi:hypothetical protein